MSRLPIPGADADNWGDILNDFLSQVHNDNGTLKTDSIDTDHLQPASVTSAVIANNAITTAKLDADVQTIIDSVPGKYVKPSGGIPASDLSAAVQTRLANTRRIQTLADTTTVTFDCDAYDCGVMTSLSDDVTFQNPTGTPTNFQYYTLRLTSDSPHILYWASQFRGSSHAILPDYSTGDGKTDYLAFCWNTTSSTWDLLAVNKGF